MHLARCLCALLPSLLTRTRLVLLIHRDEARKTSNTGMLAAACLSNSRVVVIGDHHAPLPARLVEEDEHGALLYPDPAARPIEALVSSGRPVALVVPDGGWRHVSRMRARLPGLAAMPRVSVGGPPSAYRLRVADAPERLSTIEAIARALAVLEGPAIGEALTRVFEEMVERTLRARGVPRDP